MKFTYPEGATPLDADEYAGLLPKHITTQAELNQWEQVNILAGTLWAKKQRKQGSLCLLPLYRHCALQNDDLIKFSRSGLV